MLGQLVGQSLVVDVGLGYGRPISHTISGMRSPVSIHEGRGEILDRTLCRVVRKRPPAYRKVKRRLLKQAERRFRRKP